MSGLVDGFGRKIDYVRLSLTDKCNFQCFYCRPIKSERFLRPDQNDLQVKDIQKLFLALGRLGIRKVKLTGGEPTLRRDICKIIDVLSSNPYLTDLSLTTNGFFLNQLAPALKSAGLQRLNISLDSLKSEVFRFVTQTTAFEKVWQGILRAIEVGFDAIKLNVVLMKGINDHEITDFVDLALHYPLIVRFIEFMPTRRTQWDYKDTFFSNQQAIAKIQQKYKLVSELYPHPTGPSRYYKVDGGRGRIGFISPLSHNFCDKCNRMRITAKGQLRLCLFSHEGIDLLGAIRQVSDDGQLAGQLEGIIRKSLRQKPLDHHLEKRDIIPIESFVSIGG